jgi:hypothetical protein
MLPGLALTRVADLDDGPAQWRDGDVIQEFKVAGKVVCLLAAYVQRGI